MQSRPGFLFVNKDSTSAKLTQSNGSEKAKIFRHVRPRPLHRKTSRRRILEKDGQKREREQTASAEKDWDGSVTADHALLQAQARLNSSVDHLSPLSNHGSAMTAAADHLLRIYRSDIAPLLFPVAAVAIPAEKYTLALAGNDPLMHQSLLSSVTAKIYSATGSRLHLQLTMAFKQRALKHLRHLLSQSGGERVKIAHCYAISMLIWTECVSGNSSDLEAHFSGLQSLIQRVRDTSSAPVYVLRIMYAFSYLCAAFLNVRPSIEPPEIVDESCLSTGARDALEAPQKSGFTGAGHLFLLPANLKVLGPALTLSIIEYQKAILVRDRLAADQSLGDDMDVRYVCLKEIAVEYELLNLPFNVPLNPLQNAVMLALFVYSLLPLFAATGSSAALSRNLAKQIRQDVERAETSTIPFPCASLILWVLAMGAYISQGEVEWPWYQSQILPLIDRIGLVTVSDMEITLQGHYYAPYLKGTVDLLWHELQCQRALVTLITRLDELSPAPEIDSGST